MTAAEFRLLQRVQRRAAALQPDVARSLLDAWETVRASLSPVETAKLIESGQIDAILDDALLDRAFLPLRARLRQAIEKGFTATVADLPKQGKIDGVLAVQFNTLNPKVIDAVRALESAAINTLKGEVKEVARAFIENGLRDGRAPASVARQLRAVIGLAPHQEVWIENLRDELESGNYADAARRKLIDRRFNLSKLADLTPAARAERIDTIVGAYRKSAISLNANVNARTHTLDSYKLGQKLSWEDAKANGVIPEGFVLKREWLHFDPQPNPRPEHVAMDGQIVPADQPYSNGDTYAGEGDPWGCHCIDRYRMERVERAA